MAARDVDSNCENVNYSFVLRRSVPDLSATNTLKVPYKPFACSVFLAMHKLQEVTVVKDASIDGHRDSTKNHRFSGKDHCSFHFLLKITLRVENFQKNKLLQTEYNVAAVLRLEQSDA